MRTKLNNISHLTFNVSHNFPIIVCINQSNTDEHTVWLISELELAFVKGWRLSLAPQHSILYIIGLNKIQYMILILGITGRRVVE